MDLCKQMSSSKCSFTCICGIFLPLNPSTTTVYARSAFCTQPAFYSQSAVCSLQSPLPILSFVPQETKKVKRKKELVNLP